MIRCVNISQDMSAGLEKYFCNKCYKAYKIASVWRSKCICCNAWVPLAENEMEALNTPFEEKKRSSMNVIESHHVNVLSTTRSMYTLNAIHTLGHGVAKSVIDKCIDKCFSIIEMKETCKALVKQKRDKFCKEACGLEIAGAWVHQVTQESWIFDMDGMQLLFFYIYND